MDHQLSFGVEREVLVDELIKYSAVEEIIDTLFNDHIINIVAKSAMGFLPLTMYPSFGRRSSRRFGIWMTF